MYFYRHFPTIKIAAFFISTIIGAGFASGQELLQFFLSFRSSGIFGLILTSILLGLLNWKILLIGQKRQLASYAELLYCLPSCFRKPFTLLIPCFLLMLLLSLLSAFAAIASDYLSISRNCGICLFILCVGSAAMFNNSGFIIISLLSAPLLCSGIILTSLHSACFHSSALIAIPNNFMICDNSWLTASLLYSGYNFLPLLTAVMPFSQTLSSQHSLFSGCVLGSIIFLILSLLCFQVLSLHLPVILDEELPMLSVSCTQHPLFFFIYLTLIIIAIFTTALNALCCCAIRLSTLTHLSNASSIIATLFFCLLFSKLSFPTIIHYAFPCFGLAGLLLITLIMFLPLKPKQK